MLDLLLGAVLLVTVSAWLGSIHPILGLTVFAVCTLLFLDGVRRKEAAQKKRP